MISGGQLLGFTLASLVLIVIPGPGVLFVVGRALAHGRRTALAASPQAQSQTAPINTETSASTSICPGTSPAL